MASETAKQDEDKDNFNPNDVTSAHNPQPTSLPEKQIVVILTTVTKGDGETDDEYRCQQAFVKPQLSQYGTDASSDRDYFIQFVTKSS